MAGWLLDSGLHKFSVNVGQSVGIGTFTLHLAFHVALVDWTMDIPSKEDVTRFSPDLSSEESLHHHWDTKE